MGNDTLTGDDNSGGQGSDIFVLTAGDGQDTILDFEVGVDAIALIDLTVEELSFAGNDILFNGETLATLVGVNPAALSQADFLENFVLSAL